MNYFIFIVSIIYLCNLYREIQCNPVDDNTITILTKENWNDVITKEASVLVDFYTPWCPHCKDLSKEFYNAATELNNQKSLIKLAKVDCDDEQELCDKFKIVEIPKMIYFNKGKQKLLEEKGDATKDTILTWLKENGSR